MKKLSLLLSFLFIISLFGCHSEKEDTKSIVEAYRNSAQILLDNGDFSSAIDLLTSAINETGDATLTSMLEEAILLKAQLEETQLASEETTSEIEPITSPSPPTLVDVQVSDVYNDGVSALPQIGLNYENVIGINQEIYDSYVPMVEAGYYSSYDWYVNRDVLSLVIYGAGDSFEFYTVYNVSISSGSSLDKEAVLAAVGLDIGQYKILAKACLTSYFNEVNSAFASDPGFSSKLEDTVSEDNIEASQVFLGEDGILYAVAYIGSFVGADGYDHIVEISQ